MAHAPNPPLNTKCRSDRGLENDITGRLLCPIEYDWEDEKWVLLLCIVLHILKSLLTVFVMESVREPLTYPKTISFDVSTRMGPGILIMSRRDFSAVVYLSRFLSFLPCFSLTHCYVGFDRHILISLFRPHRLNLSAMKTKAVQRENRNVTQIHRGKRLNVMLQTLLAWTVELLHAQLPMQPF